MSLTTAVKPKAHIVYIYSDDKVKVKIKLLKLQPQHTNSGTANFIIKMYY